MYFTGCLLIGQRQPDDVQEIYQDRKKFSEQVFKVASSDLVNMGIGVVSYTLKDVHDDQVFSIKSKRENFPISGNLTKQTTTLKIFFLRKIF